MPRSKLISFVPLLLLAAVVGSAAVPKPLDPLYVAPHIYERVLETAMYPNATFKLTGMEGFPTGYTDGQEASFQLLGDLPRRGALSATSLDSLDMSGWVGAIPRRGGEDAPGRPDDRNLPLLVPPVLAAPLIASASA